MQAEHVVDIVGFDDLHEDFKDDIYRWSFQRVPGMTREEVEVEITLALWKAFRGYDYDQGVLFETYWYRVWMNHKGHLIEAFFRRKRQMSTPMSPKDIAELGAAYGLDEELKVPDVEPIAQRAWVYLAAGYTKKEVMNLLGVTRWRFDAIIAALRTPEVRALIA